MKIRLLLLCICVGSVGGSASAGEPWISVSILGEPPINGSEQRIEAIAFADHSTDARLEVGVASWTIAKNDCRTGIELPAIWTEEVAWQWKATDGREIQPPAVVKSREVARLRTLPVRLGLGERESSTVSLPSMPIGTFTVTVSVPIAGCAGWSRVSSRPFVVRVLEGSESNDVRAAYLRSKLRQARHDFADYEALSLELAELKPDNTGVWEELAIAAAGNGDIDATVRYLQRFLDTTKAKMEAKYGPLPKWPSAAQKRWRHADGRNSSLRSVVASGVDKDLRISVTEVGSGWTFALVDRKSGQMVRRLE